MNFSFCICSTGSAPNIDSIIGSIRELHIPQYEIIITNYTGKYATDDDIKVIVFDEHVRTNWISKKKNLMIHMAMYDNLVVFHDYIVFDKEWYNGFLKFGNNFDICTTRVLNNNRRFRDYCIFPYASPTLQAHLSFTNSRCLLPYDLVLTKNINKLLYISGSYYVVKKRIAESYKWNETLVWGESDDVLLSKELARDNILMQCNHFSRVHFLKEKSHSHFDNELLQSDIELIIKMPSEICNKINNEVLEDIKKHYHVT